MITGALKESTTPSPPHTQSKGHKQNALDPCCLKSVMQGVRVSSSTSPQAPDTVNHNVPLNNRSPSICVSLRGTALGHYLPFLLLIHVWLSAVVPTTLGQVANLLHYFFLSYSFLHFFSFPFFVFVFFFYHFSRDSLHVDGTKRDCLPQPMEVFLSWSQQSDLVFSAIFVSVTVLGYFHWCTGCPAALNRRCQTAERQLSGGIHGPLCKLKENITVIE